MPSRSCQNIFGQWVASGSVFEKWYELHYQPKTMETPEGS
jgi:hypothetical protein